MCHLVIIIIIIIFIFRELILKQDDKIRDVETVVK